MKLENYKLNKPMFGIDVSLWQRDLNYSQAVNDGVEFVIIKATEGKNIIDPEFENHYQEAIKNKMHVGAYHYLTATTDEDVKAEMQLLDQKIMWFEWDMPIFVDVEDAYIAALGQEEATRLVLLAIQMLKDMGYLAGIYTYKEYLTHALNYDKLKTEILWIGNISTECPKIEGLKIWQFGGNRNLISPPEIGGVVCDQNYCYYDFPSMIEDMAKTDYNSYAGDDNNPAEWARPSVDWAIENGLIKGDERGLRLRDHVTREELCVILDRLNGMKGE